MARYKQRGAQITVSALKLLLAVSLLVVATQAQAGPINAGFETGSYPPWLTFGDNSVIGPLAGTPPIGPPEGSFQSFSTTNPSPHNNVTLLEVFLGVAPGALTAVGNGTVYEGSAIKQTFAVTAGETVSLLWNFLTHEAKSESTFNDFAFYVLDSTIVKLADTGSTFVPAPGTADFGCASCAGQTGFNPLALPFPAAGIHTLAFGVVDVGDTANLSGLLVDAAPVPEPATLFLLGSGLAGLAAWRRWHS